MGNRYMLFAGTLAGALAIGAIVSLLTGDWLFLLLALAVHVLGTSAVLLYTAVTTSRSTEPEELEQLRREQQRLAELRRRARLG